MKHQLEQIYLEKKNQNKKLSRLRVDLLATLFDGAIKNKNIRAIHKDIRKVIEPYGRNIKFEKYAVAIAKNMKKGITYNNDALIIITNKEDAIAEQVYKKFQKNDYYEGFKQIAYAEQQREEAKKKEEVIGNTLKESRHDGKIFYIASSHDDSAKDHRDYQGKIYVDEKWKNIDNSKEVVDYINKHDVKTFQWVTGSPVWFITRPNCRHYFKVLKTDDVLTHTTKELLKNHKMHTKIGKREGQTIRHPIDKGWYTEGNIRGIIEKYKERLQYHEALYKVRKLKVLRDAIAKDKFLIEKWSKYLTNILH